ncbi:MAG: winged helix-turn-helix domain-containing protein [Promethearchaeota archaeon]
MSNHDYTNSSSRDYKAKRRSKFEIWAELLEACLYTPRTQSWLIRRLRSNTSAVKNALSFLVNLELIEEIKNIKTDNTEFRTTIRGEEALNQYYQLITKFFGKIQDNDDR